MNGFGFRRRRVPVMLQLSAAECGAASLAMLLSYYGRSTPVAEVRDAVDVGRDGTTALTLLQVGRQFGLRVRAFSVQPEALRGLPLPAIVHWNFNHFMVVERWTPTQVTVVDPAVGRRTLSAEEFDAGFTGVVLTMEPGERFERRGRQGPPAWRRYLRDLMRVPGARGVAAQLLGASLVLQLFGLGLPLLTALLVDQVLPWRMGEVMPMLAVGGAMIVLAQLTTAYLRSSLLVHLQAQLDAHLTLAFFAHVLALPFRFFQQRASGDLITRITNTMVLRETLTEQVLSAVLDGALVVSYLLLLVAQAPGFGLLVVGLALLQLLLLLSAAPRLEALTQRHLLTQAESQAYLVEALTNIATVKASGVEERVFEAWSRRFAGSLGVAFERGRLEAALGALRTALRSLGPLLLLWFGALQVLDGAMSLGAMFGLLALATACLTPLGSLVEAGQRLQLVGTYMDRIQDVMGAEPEQAIAARGTVALAGRIELRRVSFRYDAHAPWVLRDLSLVIEPGQKVALVGRSGSGKSTLAMLLLGLYRPGEGEILYDGVPMAQLDYRALRRQFGAVLQEPALFSGSIRENIALGNPGASLEQVADAARRAAIHEDILAMPMGYETLLAEGGRGLSGGQRQRIALARALVADPAVLLLDEATSHLDTLTERAIDASLNTVSCTRIVIAHRLSTIHNADQILVLDQGQLVERGSHDELLGRGGVYARLAQSQAEPAPR